MRFDYYKISQFSALKHMYLSIALICELSLHKKIVDHHSSSSRVAQHFALDIVHG